MLTVSYCVVRYFPDAGVKGDGEKGCFRLFPSPLYYCIVVLSSTLPYSQFRISHPFKPLIPLIPFIQHAELPTQPLTRTRTALTVHTVHTIPLNAPRRSGEHSPMPSTIHMVLGSRYVQYNTYNTYKTQFSYARAWLVLGCVVWGKQRMRTRTRMRTGTRVP